MDTKKTETTSLGSSINSVLSLFNLEATEGRVSDTQTRIDEFLRVRSEQEVLSMDDKDELLQRRQAELNEDRKALSAERKALRTLNRELSFWSYYLKGLQAVYGVARVLNTARQFVFDQSVRAFSAILGAALFVGQKIVDVSVASYQVLVEAGRRAGSAVSEAASFVGQKLTAFFVASYQVFVDAVSKLVSGASFLGQKSLDFVWTPVTQSISFSSSSSRSASPIASNEFNAGQEITTTEVASELSNSEVLDQVLPVSSAI